MGGASAGACDLTETCPIASAACPADAKRTGVCRATVGNCDIAESCDAVSNACPPDNVAPNGTSCDDGDVCTTPDECQSGSCIGDAATCGNATVEASCGEECDDGNSQDGDGCSADCLLEGAGVPTIPDWGLIVLAALVLGSSFLMMRRGLRLRA